MEIIISNSSDKPIYEQITSQIKNQIITGKLRGGSAALHAAACQGAAHQRDHHQTRL